MKKPRIILRNPDERVPVTRGKRKFLFDSEKEPSEIFLQLAYRTTSPGWERKNAPLKIKPIVYQMFCQVLKKDLTAL